MCASKWRKSHSFFVFALWTLSVSSASAGEGSGLLREIGVRGSVVRANHGGAEIEGSSAERIAIFGSAVGAFARMDLGRLRDVGIGLQPELGYSQRGADVELDGVYLGNTRTSYLDFALLGRIEAPALGLVVFHAAAGPTLGVLLTATTGTMDGESTDSREDASKWDASLTLGVGATLDISERLLLDLETRYVHGFVSIDGTDRIEVLNRAIFLSLAVSVRFGTDETPSMEN